MVSRKPVLLIDNTESSQMAIKILQENNVQFVEYHINKFELDCCVDLPTTQAPALFAPEGVFRNLQRIREYLTIDKNRTNEVGESAYW